MVLMITSLTSIVIASLSFSFYELKRYKMSKETELAQIVDLLGPQARQFILAGDSPQAEKWLQILSGQRNVRAAALYDAHGEFFAGYQRVPGSQVLPRSLEEVQEIYFAKNIFTCIKKLYQDDTLEGFFYLSSDLHDARSGFLSILLIFGIVTVVTLVVAYFLALLLHKQFKKPIVSLVDTARFICEKKDFKARARKYSSDEMGLLTDTINSMLDEIARRDEEMQDLTEQLELRVENRTAALQEINARLLSEKIRADQAATVKSDFLANMSHEIRTPMNGIVAACDLAMDEKPPVKVANYLRIVQESSHDLLLIINDILDFSRLEAGTLVLDRNLFSLPDLLAELYDFFSVKAHDDGIDLVIDTDSEVPSILIGDRARFRQILYNLVDNGIKFSHEGMVSLYVSCLNVDDNEASLEVRVRDTGVGLCPEGKERIFRSFHQEDSSSTREYGGTGLGLAISRQLARMMQGTITVESELGKGATFIVTVRMGWKDIEIGEATSSPVKKKKITGEKVDFCGLHVLVVEDNETNRGVAEAMLTAMGITVESVENGKEAVDIAFQGCYDAILMDMQMPVMDGYQAMQKIRQEGACKEVPIIAMTAHALSEDKEQCLQAGADAYISKPVHKKRLQDLLATVLREKGHLVGSTDEDDPFDSMETGAEFVAESSLVDVEKAIRQLGIRDDVYHRVLKTFCVDYQTFKDDYIQSSRENDIGKIQKMVHSLKGSSATVGAESLSKLATEADKICKTMEMPPDTLAGELLSCLDDVLAFAHKIDKDESGSVAEPDDLTVKYPDKILQQLHDLADSLDQSLYDTINTCLEELEENASGKRVVSLSKMIRMYSYEDALSLVRKLIEEIELTLRQ